MSLLELKNLSIDFDTLRGPLKAVDRVSFSVDGGETLGIVGESGCGKSITSLALMGLLAPNARVTADSISFQGQNLLELSENKRRKIRGGEMAMIFQDPMTSLNPCFTVGDQISEAIRIHTSASRSEQRMKSIELLEKVGIPDAENRLTAYPHELSGGMSQRVMIAMAIACRPRLLIADEPTTALDVTIQAQILDLLRDLQKEFEMALILITHDIAVVSEMADRTLVMYAGEVVEAGQTQALVNHPTHPYTKGLLSCLPEMNESSGQRSRLPSIPGLVPDLAHRPTGCQMNPRCSYADDRCRSEHPKLEENQDREVRCFKPLQGGV